MLLARTAPLAVAALLLVGCPSPVVPPADVPRDTADAATDAADATEDAPPFDAQRTIRCGPEAVPYPTDAGACFAAMPLPDGGVPPPGRCTARVLGPTATVRTNQMDGDAMVIPSGRRIQRAAERRTLSGFPMSTLRLPGTALVVVSDGGIHTNRLRVIDTSRATLDVVAGGEQAFPRDGTGRDPALFYGMAFDPTARILYASGGGGNRIYAFTVSAAGALSPEPGRTLDLGITEAPAEGVDAMGNLRAGFVAGMALSDDGTQLYAAMQRGHALIVVATATRTVTRVIPFDAVDGGGATPYVVVRRPGDSRHVYVSLWGTQQVAEVDVQGFAVTRLWSVGKNPEEMVFRPDGRLYVTASDSDSVAVIDTSMPGNAVQTHYLGGGASAPRGASPTALAMDASNRLYVVLAAENAVDVLDADSFARIGRIATEWYPTDVDVAADGTVVVVTGKGLGTGANTDPSMDEITQLAQGSIARYAAPSVADLQAGDATVTRNNAAMLGFNDVTCPDGAAYDFPIPAVGSTAGSTRIRNVVFVIRENKTYDAILGDYAGAPGDPADGDPNLTLVPRDRTDAVFPNFRALVRQFAHLDNYYSNAEQSIQGHIWTTMGRTTDYVERSWLTTWGRGQRSIPSQGLLAVGLPEEGSIFHAMLRANVPTQNWGEVVASAGATQSVGSRYPGVFYNMSVPDMDKARAFGVNVLERCDLARFSYILLPNDHTYGGSAGRPTPASMIQDNDEATGYLIDAISHSRYWPETLVVVIEDDPQDGGDHVDNHRSVALLASPWVRRGRTSHVHYDEASIHRTIELILGVPPHNATVAAAAPLYDAFTGTPDFTPFTYIPRRECPTLNPMMGLYADESARMDFSAPDNAPGLSRLVWRMHHAGAEPPWAAAPPTGDDDDD